MSDERPIFQWDNFGRSIVVLLVDFVIMVVLIGSVGGLFYFILIHCNMQNPKLFTGYDYVDIIRSIVWPIFSLIVLMLFRNPLMRILYELPGFVRRSHYGQVVFSKKEKEGALRNDPENKEKKFDFERDVKEAFNPVLGSTSRDEADVLRTTNKVNEVKDHMTEVDKEKEQKSRLTIDYENIEKIILKKLKKEYMVSDVKRNVRIRESNIVFDGAFWGNDHLYGIEIKMVRNPNQVKDCVERVAMFVQGLPKKYRENFSLILCVITETELSDLRERMRVIIDSVDFEIIIKHYLFSDVGISYRNP